MLPVAKGVTVSESWRHQLIRLEAGRKTEVLRHLPGFPARISPAADGGAWLALFAPRNRLIEFVLQETHYRYDMMAEVPRENWIAPALSSGRSFLEPLQCGGIKTLGVHKAWSPSRSCGMVVRLGADMTPLASWHSRANGNRHGTTCALQAGGRLFVASKGSDCVLSLDGGNVMDTVIRLEKITKSYRSVPAVREVDFDLRRGEIHALLGENGAGKSTLTKVIAGVVAPSSGRMFYRGVETRFENPHQALQGGISMVFQKTSLVPSMTVAQNLYLGAEPFLNRLRGTYISAQQFLQSVNFSVDPAAMVESLGAAKHQMVEIARAVHHSAEVIIFDKPTVALTPEEKCHFFALLRRLKARGVSIVFISHALEEALAVSDRITILRDGELVMTGNTRDFDRDKIIGAMVGRSLSGALYQPRSTLRKAGAKVLSVQDISMEAMVRNTSFSIFAGQITGVFGLIGSGRTETFKVVAGITKRDFSRGGTIELHDRPVRYRTPHPAVQDGIIYVTEDRKTEGFFETMSMGENLFGGMLAAGHTRAALVRMSDIAAIAGEWTAKLTIKSINANARVVELSGGNQQKVAIGKGLIQKSRVVIFDEPTRGVDVAAIAEIHQIINALADDGLAVVMISSYLPEIMNLSDRILVCRQGRIVEEPSPTEASEEKIMYAAVH